MTAGKLVEERLPVGQEHRSGGDLAYLDERVSARLIETMGG